LYYRLKKFLSYYTKATTHYSVHSPHIFEFILDVMDTKKEYYVYKKLEFERRILLTSHEEIPLTDHGAGSKTANNKSKKISTLARTVVSRKEKCRLLFNLINKYRPHNVIELGTSLGMSTMYMAAANASTQIYTIEADPQVYKIARTLFIRNECKNINALLGTFESKLPEVMNAIDSVGAAYIDGHHSYEATMHHFHTLCTKATEETIMIFDDIYWSPSMTQAWEEIKADARVTYSIDTFDFGIAFFNPIMEKQHFTLISYWKKFFNIGLFG
jgi:predicted O-methyltransferase YrrM